MAKLTLTDITTGYASAAAQNANNALIEAALENTLSRDGTSPNTMSAQLDMNSQRITNLPNAVNNSEPVTLAQAASLAGVTGVLTKAGVQAVLNAITSDEATVIAAINDEYTRGDGRRFNMVEDSGTTDNAQALLDAIEYADASAEPLYLIGGTGYYQIDSAVTLASISNPIRMIGIGSPEIRMGGTTSNYMLQITDTNGHDVSFEGIHFNANDVSATCVRIDNPSASMADTAIGELRFRDCLLENTNLQVGNTYSSSGIQAVGGFREILLDNVVIRQIDRANGSGSAGVRGCAGVLVAFDDINGYCRKFTMNGGQVDTVTHQEAANDTDVDGLNITMPTATANSGNHLPGTVHVTGVRFKDCKGRALKTQADGMTIVRDVVVERGLEEAIANAVDFDFQRGGGYIDGVLYYANETSGGATTWGTSHVIANYGPDQLATTAPNADGGFHIRNVIIHNAIATGVDTLPIFLSIVNDDSTRPIGAISMKDCSVIGGRLARWVKLAGSTTDEINLTVDNCVGDTTTSLIQFSSSTGSSVTHVRASGNINLTATATTPVFIELADNVEPMVTGHSNLGWVENLLTGSSASTIGPRLNTPLIGGDAVDGHAIATFQTVSLADDASHAFEATGGYGIGFITNNFSDGTQAIFTHTTNAFDEIQHDGAASTLITYGTTTDPNIDGDLNIWITGGDTINIQNKLGSTRVFHFIHFGGN